MQSHSVHAVEAGNSGSWPCSSTECPHTQHVSSFTASPSCGCVEQIFPNGVDQAARCCETCTRLILCCCAKVCNVAIAAEQEWDHKFQPLRVRQKRITLALDLRKCGTAGG